MEAKILIKIKKEYNGVAQIYVHKIIRRHAIQLSLNFTVI